VGYNLFQYFVKLCRHRKCARFRYAIPSVWRSQHWRR